MEMRDKADKLGRVDKADKNTLGIREICIKACPVMLLIVLEIVFFRNIIFSDGLIGNRLDGRYTNWIAEHWYEFFSGKKELGYIPEFYPMTNWGLTSSVLMMLNGMVHSLFRTLGFDFYDAFKLAIMLVHFFGTICMYVFLNKKMGMKPVWAIAGTCIFSFSNNYAVKLYHTQLVVMSLIPFMLIMIAGFVKNYRTRYKRNIYAFALIISMAIGVYTDWYMVYYFALFGVLLLLIYSLLLKKNKIMSWKKQINIVKEMGIDILYYLLFGVVVLVPFLCIYLPTFSQNNGGWGWKMTSYYIPSFKDLVNYGSGNLVFGSCFQFDPLDTTETLGGISPVVLICIILSLVKCILVRKSKKSTYLDVMVFSGLIVSILLLVCSIKLDNTNISLWYLFYKFCPAASSLRAVGRIWLFLTLPFAIAISYIFGKTCEDIPRNKAMLAGGILLSMVILFDLRTEGVYSCWSSGVEQNNMKQIEANMPDDVNLFYVINTDETLDEFAIPDEYHIDALAIAEQFGLCTINGYTGVYPDNYWGLLWYVTNENYIYGVAEWIRLHNIDERGFDYIYQYDIYTNTWTKMMFE